MHSLLRCSLAITAASVFAAVPLRAQQPLRLDLNIPALRLVVYEGDSVLQSYPVAVGDTAFQTPTGEFRVSSAEWNPWWRPPARAWAKDDKLTPPGPENPMGRVKLFFTNLYYLHGTPDEKSIGSAASHGCVRMRNRDVIALATLLQERTGTGKGAAFVKRVTAGRTTTRVGLPNGVPLTIRYEPVVVDGRTLRIYRDVYGRGSAHTEGVYQALMNAGYDIKGLARADVRALLERAKLQKGTFTLPISEAFGGAAVPALLGTESASR